jgi:GAF domain-containing protein
LFNETQEALEQQKASADVLGAISKSVADTAPVFEEILGACQRLFGGEEIGIYTFGDDQMVRAAAWRGPHAEEVLRDVTPVGESVTGRIIRERRTHHIPDHAAESNLSPTLRERAERLGSASLLYAPMLSEDRGLGSILVVRSPPRPFSDREQALLQSFADQAAIAIQNARLFNETQEALERQTATAEILKVIASSPSDAQPVFDAIAASAKRLVGAKSAVVFRVIDGMIHLVARTGFATKDAEAALLALYPRPYSESLYARIENAGKPFDAAGLDAVPPYLRDAFRRGGLGASFTAVPMMSLGRVLGVVSVLRNEDNSLPVHHVQLLQTFADQAVIAIENARLFGEVQAKTRDLEESLAQQTATADVLKVISRSAFDLQTVFDTLTRSAVELAGATHGSIHIRDGEVFPQRSHFGFNPNVVNLVRQNPIAPGRGTLAGRVALSGRVESIPDVLEDAEYSPSMKPVIETRSLLGVPLLRGEWVEGMMILARAESAPFAPRQIELVRTFADQAVIALENARLFAEVQAKTRDLEESLAQQTMC